MTVEHGGASQKIGRIIHAADEGTDHLWVFGQQRCLEVDFADLLELLVFGFEVSDFLFVEVDDVVDGE